MMHLPVLFLSRLGMLLLLTPVAGSSIQDPADPPKVGFVAQLEGTWMFQSSKGSAAQDRKVSRGQALSAGVLRPSAPDAMILVALFDGTTRSCTAGKGECRIEAREFGPNGFRDRLSAALRRFFTHPEDKYVSTISRAPGRPLREAVVALDPTGLDLGPALPGDGTYLLLVQPKAGEQKGEIVWGDGKTVEIEVRNGNASPVALGSLAPGLYRLLELDRFSKDHEPTGRVAWIAAVPPGSAREMSASFRQAQGLAEAWSAELGPAMVQGQLRAYLELLSETAEPRHPEGP